jgi:hypothetical protein
MSDEQPLVRKRGRPRKKVIKKNTNFIPEKNKDIILKLKLCSDDDSSESSSDNSVCNNFFTIDETTEACNKEPDYISNSDSSNNSLNIDDLYKELNKKELLIKQLTERINNIDTCDRTTLNTSSNNIIRRMHDLKLIDIKNNSEITVKSKTDIKCWHCTHNFNNPPCFIPDKYINGNFYVFGCFCSFNCASTYNLEILNDARVKIRQSLILILFHKIFGNNKTLVYAPKKELLKDYGGNLTINEFRKTFMVSDKEYKLNIPPMIPLVYEIETRQR